MFVQTRSKKSKVLWMNWILKTYEIYTPHGVYTNVVCNYQNEIKKLIKIIQKAIFLGLVTFLISSCNPNKSIENKSSEEIVEHFATEFLDDDRIHSVSIALYNNGKESTFHFGEQNPNKENPPTDSTLYELASVTKTFTGTMVAKAVLDG